jgi:hypothetical protein
MAWQVKGIAKVCWQDGVCAFLLKQENKLKILVLWIDTKVKHIGWNQRKRAYLKDSLV